MEHISLRKIGNDVVFISEVIEGGDLLPQKRGYAIKF